jgi:hypothetical protein
MAIGMNRPTVAYLCSQDTMPGARNRREDAYEHDLSIGILGMGLHYAGRSIAPVRWDDPATDWQQFEAAVIGTAWDYAQRCDDFLVQLRQTESQCPLFNSAELVAWNSRKTYLADLAVRGCPVVPTLWLDQPAQADCCAAFDHFGSDRIVIKPQVGAGAWRQVLLGRADDWPQDMELPQGPAMVQPFVPAIASEGEYSFLFFNRRFSHAVLKTPANGDYRIQSSYGGSDRPVTPDDQDIRAAAAVLEAVQGNLLYARVDMVRGDAGSLMLMELELIEPFLYPVHAPRMAAAFADAYCTLTGSPMKAAG